MYSKMWYVIQVKSGDEQDIKLLLDKIKEPDVYSNSFVPLFEDVKRSGGKCTIAFRKLFPGYIFVESKNPQGIFDVLGQVPEFTKLLGSVENDGTKLFIPVGEDDEAFLNSLFSEGIMRVSYIHMGKSGRIDKILGPLSKYRNYITKLEVRHRMAVVETELFGKRRKIKFGLWIDDDPVQPWIEKLKSGSLRDDDIIYGTTHSIDIGIHPGDRVVDETGVYGDQVFVVKKVDAKRRLLTSSFEMFGTVAGIELRADDVRKV